MLFGGGSGNGSGGKGGRTGVDLVSSGSVEGC